jgi:hypothetical protein
VDSEWGIDVLRTVGHIVGDTKRQRDEAEENVHQAPPPAPATPRPSTAGNKRLKGHFSTLKNTKSSVYLSEKEEVWVTPNREPQKSNGRWKRVGVLDREAVVQGIRSLFH